MKPETQSRIENLLAESDTDTIPQDVLAAANTEFKAKREAQQKELIVRYLDIADRGTANAVDILRNARKKERKAKVLLSSLAEAEDNLKATGNWEEYSKASAAAHEVYGE